MVTSVQDTGVSSALMDTMNKKKTTEKSAVEETQDRFMKLLVTQMRNQDPMNPLDNAQVTSQFAQLSTVSGIDKLIGHGVLTTGSGVDLVKGAGLMGVEFTAPVDKAQVTIRDAAGKEVRTLNLGPQEIGSVPLTWDGKTENGTAVADGHYTFEVTATRGSETVAATALQFGLVDTVSTSAKGVKLNVGGLGAVDFANIRQIL
jgi:flagellar basal-body rod modification protein FlgD